MSILLMTVFIFLMDASVLSTVIVDIEKISISIADIDNMVKIQNVLKVRRKRKLMLLYYLSNLIN
jgi:hypothetical protein